MSLPNDSSQDSSLVGNLLFSPGEEDNDNFEGEKTDQEVSKYSFMITSSTTWSVN
jgi:hypothetical protein